MSMKSLKIGIMASEYEMGNFGIEIKVIDIDFDGHPDRKIIIMVMNGGVSSRDVYILRNDGLEKSNNNLDWNDKGFKYFLDLGNNQIGVLIYQDG